MARRLTMFLLLATVFFGNGPPTYGQGSTSLRIPWVELSDIDGWLANRYPWQYFPEFSTVHPVDSIWDPPRWDFVQEKYIPQYQSQPQVAEETRILEEYGSGADVLEFNVCPSNPDYNHWLRTYLGNNSKRPFFILYEHVYGNCNYVEHDGAKNMNLTKNRQAFAEDIEFIVKNIVLPNKERYVTVGGRAVIFMWSATSMTGDFARMLQIMKTRYPVFFIGSVEIMSLDRSPQTMRNLRSFDGFMEYGLVNFDKDESGAIKPDNYMTMVRSYDEASAEWRKIMLGFGPQPQTKAKYLFIPTFQAAYDDTKLPDRNNPPMYPRTHAEMEHHAEVINRRVANGTDDGYEDFYDDIGPFIVGNELPEGAAVTKSQLPPEPERRLKECQPGQPQAVPGNPKLVACGYAGYDTGRLDVAEKYFGKN